MPKPDRWTRRGLTQDQVDRALIRIGEMQDDPNQADRWYRDGGALKCDSVLLLDEILRQRHYLAEAMALIDRASRMMDAAVHGEQHDDTYQGWHQAHWRLRDALAGQAPDAGRDRTPEGGQP